jgi:ABC-type nitrate/sulfonate/bicarbonate transport system permease component
VGAEDDRMTAATQPGADLITQVEAPALAPEQGFRSTRTARLLGGVLSAAVSLGLVLGLWIAFLDFFDINDFIARRPNQVWDYLFDGADGAAHRRLMFDQSMVTLRDAFVGLVIGSVTAVLASMLFNVSRTAERTLMPFAMVLRSIPVIALAPVIVIVVGNDIKSVALIASIVTFFPTLVNVTLALRATPKESIDLLRAYGGTKRTTMRKVQFPSALPALFASLRVAAPLALVGALLAEWLATSEGLGAEIYRAGAKSEYSGLWTRVVLVTIYSIVLYKVIGAIERQVLARYAPSYGR